MIHLRTIAIATYLLLATASVATSLDAAANANANTAARVPDDYHMAMLIHSAVSALDQANRTANYDVLRSLAAPAFQRANSSVRLARIFERLRNTRLSLAPAILHDPLLKRPARIDHNGHLHLTGFFPTRPMRIHFDLHFQNVAGHWRLFGISIQPRRERQARAG